MEGCEAGPSEEALCKAGASLPPPGWTLKCSIHLYPTPSSQARSNFSE